MRRSDRWVLTNGNAKAVRSRNYAKFLQLSSVLTASANAILSFLFLSFESIIKSGEEDLV